MWGRLDSSLPVNIQAKSTGLVWIHTEYVSEHKSQKWQVQKYSFSKSHKVHPGFSFINVAYAQKEGSAQI